MGAPVAGGGARTTARGRVGALARAEVALFLRNRGTLFTALFVPFVLPLTVRSGTENMDLDKAGLDLAEVLLPAAMGFSLLFAVYTALTTTFVARREELVLKRLRTGEASDAEVLAGASVPAAAVGFVQCLLVAVGCALLLGVEAPEAPHLALLGVLLGLALCAVLGALTASFTRTVESAGVTVMPFLLVAMLGSGITVPLEVMPDRVAGVCELLPLSPAVQLIRAGWTGDLSGYETLGATATALAWIVVCCFAVRRWFRWEPRR
ncbi:ABC transporter permease [Streptomyces sp. NA04227]|uniref:ABC transporter permease n=1 Tax=Streptomyces sp. NA04227 TaxID=2742136 RepID=UPI0015905245|nr:ABC transporter permease [Streptomyces sp. NA04227]QKW07982.1 ABC transporter permease [Streptomyces sp. NA04227]